MYVYLLVAKFCKIAVDIFPTNIEGGQHSVKLFMIWVLQHTSRY